MPAATLVQTTTPRAEALSLMRAEPRYNAPHRFWEPLAMGSSVELVVLGGLPVAWVAGAMAWGFHIALDRAIGLRLRSHHGFQQSGRP
jgi:hypothetical protein